ncbi:hypothetical protein LCGC14_1393580 [marine sediment metagenome]|uniref:Uncharacterized protein n=1 Tax=marine sediment metagenome TaxID=412755 RepID=A0A0F9KK08_9ZZZZ
MKNIKMSKEDILTEDQSLHSVFNFKSVVVGIYMKGFRSSDSNSLYIK